MKIDGMKRGLGKTIQGFILKAAPGADSLRGQLCIVFTDGTWLEFYSTGGPIYGTSDINHGGMAEARNYTIEHFQDVITVSLSETGEINVTI